MLSLSRCALCRTNASKIWGCCADCFHSLELEFEPYRNSKNVMVIGSYKGKLKQAVTALKYQRVTALAKLLGMRLAEEIRSEAYRFNHPIPQRVCAVPLHWQRWIQRGYNQSRLLAEVIATSLECTYVPLLTRVRATPSQVTLSGEARRKNVAGAFRINQKNHRAQQNYILLIDDVVTTGATIQTCAKVLEKAELTVVMAAIAEA